jgi:SAM-dependent methyltransferase
MFPNLRGIARSFKNLILDVITFSNPGYQVYLFASGARKPKLFPDHDWKSSTLQDTEEWLRSVAKVRELGLLERADSPKSWDSLKAVSCILANVPKESKVLDAGGTLSSTPLVWLYQYGFRGLFAIDLVFTRPNRRGSIRYLPGDLTQTSFPSNYFDAITCLSVIEHGVDMYRFFQEMRRLLKPRGLLLVSTDYWSGPVDTSGLFAYNANVHVFNRVEIEKFLNVARDHGFRVIGEKEKMLECKEKSVRWTGLELDFTYLFLAFEKVSG